MSSTTVGPMAYVPQYMHIGAELVADQISNGMSKAMPQQEQA